MSTKKRYDVRIDGGVSGQMAVGENINQTAIHGPVTEADLAEVRRRIAALQTKVAKKAPPEQQEAARQQLDELGDAILADIPDVGVMVRVRDWFSAYLPKLAGAVTGLIINPLVGKIVEAAGDLVATRFRNEFGPH